MKGSKIIEIIFHTISKYKEGKTLIIETVDRIFLTLKQLNKPKNVFLAYRLFTHFSTCVYNIRDDLTESRFLIVKINNENALFKTTYN
jgi:hypothetical protein